MKKTRKYLMAIALISLLLGLVTATVSATDGTDNTGGWTLGAVFVIIGGAILVGGFRKVKGVPKVNPWIAVAGCAFCLVLAGAFIGYLVIPNPFASADTPADGAVCASFSITPTGCTTGILNSAKTGFTVPAYGNQTGYTILQVDNSTAWADPTFTFAVEPVMFSGADADDLAGIVVEVTNPDLTIDTTTDDYYLVTKSGGNRQWVWDLDGNTKYVSGNTQMLLTGNASITLTPDINQDSFARIEDTYDSVTAYIKFSNICGDWSQTFKIDFMLTHTW